MAIVDWPAAPTWSRAAFLALALVLAGAGLVSAGSASAASHPAPPKAAQTTFALVTGEDSNELGTVDLDTRPPVFEPALDMSGSPRDVVVAGNKTAYVLEAGPRDIAVVDLTGPNFVTTAPRQAPDDGENAYPTSLALTPDDSRAFVTFGWGSPMEVVDLTKTPPVVSAQIPVPFGSQATDAAITPDGKTALVISVNNAIAFPVDLTTNPPTPGPAIQLPPDAQPCGVTVAPNGRFALVTNGSKRSVTMIDLTKTPPVAAPAIDTAAASRARC